MPRRKKGQSKKKTRMPIVPVEKIKESISQNHFELAVSNWLVTRWIAHDYGIDAMVEITSPLIDAEARIATGKKFSVQIKARGDNANEKCYFQIGVEVSKIRYWLNSTEPVMMCRFDINSKKMHYRWIDDSLVSELTRKNPRWLSQENVVIPLNSSDELNQDNLGNVESYVLRWKQAVRSPLNPGDYFKLRDRTLSLYTNISPYIPAVEFPSLKRNLDDLKKKIEQATYTVAITGPSRAGKSTLLNALVRHEISPVNVLPTTGLPLAVVGGDKDDAEVVFMDGKIAKSDATSESLKPYVSQDENPDNEKKVKLITVKLVNAQLERGISFLDLPGLDDPSPEIQRITAAALNLTSAVIYVVDASSRATGGFSITKHHIDDLQRIGARADRLFFVLNKVDQLSKEEKDSVVELVNKVFKKYGLADMLPTEPILISAKEAWENRKSDSPPHDDTVSGLETTLWNFLISNNKVGLYRLHEACIELRNNIDKARTLMETRLLDLKRAADIRRDLAIAKTQLPSICQKIRTEKDAIKLRLFSQLDMTKDAVLNHLSSQLSTKPVQQELPSNKVLQSFLAQYAQKAVAETYELLGNEVGRLSHSVNRWVNETLFQVGRTTFDRPLSRTDKAYSIDELAVPMPEDLSAPAIGAISLGVIGLIFGPAGGLFGAVIGWLAGFIMSEHERRTRKIAEIMRRARSGYDKVFRSVKEEIVKQLDPMTSQLDEWVRDRTTMFIADVERQLSERGQEISDQEKKNIEGQLQKLSKEIPNIDELIKLLKSYSY
jgi:GTPase Era involved in 16S rRNA processing/gas vesicle protein